MSNTGQDCHAEILIGFVQFPSDVITYLQQPDTFELVNKKMAWCKNTSPLTENTEYTQTLKVPKIYLQMEIKQVIEPELPWKYEVNMSRVRLWVSF